VTLYCFHFRYNLDSDVCVFVCVCEGVMTGAEEAVIDLNI